MMASLRQLLLSQGYLWSVENMGPVKRIVYIQAVGNCLGAISLAFDYLYVASRLFWPPCMQLCSLVPLSSRLIASNCLS